MSCKRSGREENVCVCVCRQTLGCELIPRGAANRYSCSCSIRDNCGNSSLVFSERGSSLEERIPVENFSLMLSYHRNRLVDLHGMYIKLFIEIFINRFMLVCHRQGATQCSRPHTPLECHEGFYHCLSC